MLLLLADDLTGALDSAAPFAGRGLHTQVALGLGGIAPALAEKPAVLAVDLECREWSADRARAATAEALARLPIADRIFKKVDSRLKGNIAAELDAMPFRHALVAPAIPAFGRVVAAGCVAGFGIDDPIVVADRLGAHAGRCTVPDVAHQDDMAAALDRAESEGVDLLIGARGLAEALAERMTGLRHATPAVVPKGPALFVVGSRDPITLAQVDRLKAEETVTYLPAPNGILTAFDAAPKPVVLVQAVPGVVTLPPDEVAQHLAESLGPALMWPAASWLLSGGATAEAVLTRLGIRHLRLAGECLPGLGVAFTGERCIIAKSGGFGTPETLRDVAAMVTAGQAD